MKALILLLILVNLSFAQLEERIKEELRSRFGEDVKLLKIKPLGKIEKVDDITLDVEYGRFRSVAFVDHDGKRTQVILDLLWRLRVYRAKEDIRRGQVLSPSMFEEDYMWVKAIPSDLKISVDELENYVAGTNIPKGTILRRVYLRAVPAVRYGQRVKAVYKYNTTIVIFYATAMDTGHVGKVIRIKSELSDRVLRARVVSREEVEVF